MAGLGADSFREHLCRWGLEPDGEPLLTPTSRLLPVRLGSTAAMLKVAACAEELRGGRLMSRWRNSGLAPLLLHGEGALLMARGSPAPSLADMAAQGEDEQATRVICGVAQRLHAQPPPDRSSLVSLRRWFSDLEAMAGSHGGMLAGAAARARRLLSETAMPTVLHGDLHHGNVLAFDSTWRAIDPKGLIGDRAFDYVNILRNPDPDLAASRGRLSRQVEIISSFAGLDRRRLLEWAFAFCGLSACWHIKEGGDPCRDLGLMEIIAGELGA